jgi:hypothetical protein
MAHQLPLSKTRLFIACSLLPLASFAHSDEFHAKLVAADQTLDMAPQSAISIEGSKRIITGNGLPQHQVGQFPNRGNPHEITTQNKRYEVPLHPEIAAKPTALSRQPWGVAVNGVPFDPGTAEYYKRDRNSIWNYEALSGQVRLGLDTNHAHVQPSGAYHYHGLPTALFEQLSGGQEQMTLVGWAADGFPLYGLYGYQDPTDSESALVTLKSSYRVKSGDRPTGDDSPGGSYDGTFTIDYEYVAGSGDLDACGGRFGVTPEFPAGTYYYVLTNDYPFIPRMFKGTPDPSFERKRGARPPAR